MLRKAQCCERTHASEVDPTTNSSSIRFPRPSLTLPSKKARFPQDWLSVPTARVPGKQGPARRHGTGSMARALAGANRDFQGRRPAVLKQRAGQPTPRFNHKSWGNGQSAAALRTEPFWKGIGGLEEVSQAINKSSLELKR